MCNLEFLSHRAGFWSAMASNVTFQSRNVLSKKLMVKKEVSELSLCSFLELFSNFVMNNWLLVLVMGIYVFPFESIPNSFFSSLQESLDNINLFSIITVMSFFLLAPVTLLTEGVKVSPAVLQSAVSTPDLYLFMTPCRLGWGQLYITEKLKSCAGLELKTGLHEVADCCILLPCIPTGQPYIQLSD